MTLNGICKKQPILWNKYIILSEIINSPCLLHSGSILNLLFRDLNKNDLSTPQALRSTRQLRKPCHVDSIGILKFQDQIPLAAASRPKPKRLNEKSSKPKKKAILVLLGALLSGNQYCTVSKLCLFGVCFGESPTMSVHSKTLKSSKLTSILSSWLVYSSSWHAMAKNHCDNMVI